MDRNAMSRTRRIVFTGILGLGMLSLIPLAAQAWGRGGREGFSPDRAAARLTERLDLTADQQAKVKGVLEESFTKRTELREAHRKEMEALRNDTHERLAAVLTPDQATKLDEFRKDRQERWEHWRECGRGHGHGRWDEGRPAGE